MKKKNILVVDDDQCFLKVCEKMLESLGHNVVAVESAESALSKIVELSAIDGEKFDFLMVDQNMCGMSGINFLSFYRELVHDHTPVVMMSADNNKNLYNKAKTLGAMSCISKPIENKFSLMRMVDTILTN